MKLTRKKLTILTLIAIFVMAGVLSFCKYGLAEDTPTQNTPPSFSSGYQWSANSGSIGAGSNGSAYQNNGVAGVNYNNPSGFIDQNTIPELIRTWEFVDPYVNPITQLGNIWSYYISGKPYVSTAQQAGQYLTNQQSAEAQQKQINDIVANGHGADLAQSLTAKLNAEKAAADAKTAAAGNNSPPIMDIIGNIFAWLLYWVVFGISWIIAREVDLLISVMSYPININMPAVNAGWAVIRDLCNNFFIIILLAIAVGTVFRLPSYRYKEALPKLLIAAVLINFSKMITGIAIDISQIIMLTFAVPLAGIQGNNILLSALGLPDLFSFIKENNLLAKDVSTQTSSVGIGNVIVVLLWGIVVGIVAFVVIAVIVIILVYRIVALLFLAILSPLFFFGQSLDKFKGYVGEWLSMLSKYLVVGPLMLFFLWVSFTIMGFAGSGSAGNNAVKTIGGASYQSAAEARTSSTAASMAGQTQILSRAMTIPGMLNFVFVILLLVMSLQMGQKFGGKAAGFATSGLGFLDKQRKRVTSLPGMAAGRAAGSRLGSVVSRFGRLPGISMLGGGALANYFDSQRAKVLDTKAKSEQGRISNIIKAGGFNQMNEQQLLRMASDVNRHTRLAALQTLSNKGLLRDDPNLSEPQRNQRINLINKAREDFSSVPEFLQSFDDNVRKYSPNFALQSTMYTKGGQVNVEKLTSDLATGKLDISKLMGGLNEKSADLLSTSLAASGGLGTAENSLTKFIMNQTRGDQKEMEKVFGAMDDKIKDKIGGKLDETVFADATGKINDDLREKYIKASKNLNFDKLFGTSTAGVAKMENFASENGDLIAANASADKIGKIIETIGHALDAKTVDKMVSKSKEMKEKTQAAFSALAGGFTDANVATRTKALADTTKKLDTLKALGAAAPLIAAAETAKKEAKAEMDRVKNTYQNTLLSGAEFDIGDHGDKQGVLKEIMKGKKKKEVLEKMNSKNINQNFIDATYDDLSGKDYETIAGRSKEDKAALKSAFRASIDTETDPTKAAKRINKSLSADTFDATVATDPVHKNKFKAAMSVASADQLANLDDSIASNAGAVYRIMNETTPNILIDWLSSRTATNTTLRNKVLDLIQTLAPGDPPREKAKKKNLIS